ncbi:MAG: VWA domain-containing protein [Piscirickettsiaceae bacterium]|nr:VWA domain-containing protein [Piscirickettsiaceae bacterium]
MAYTQKYVLIVLLMVCLLPVRQVFATQDPISDVRIVIDVSGSMKKNDPNNLRSPALRMIVGLLPEGEKAGVWTFAKYVNMLVPHREVNEAWRIEAEKQSNNIHSYGLFTNIEQALNKATVDQRMADSKFRRSVILLSDGLVDVSINEEVSKVSRQRILDTLVPRLKKANVAVHTIALADTADHALLRDISLATDGWYEQVDNAEQLQRVFLHLFEKAAQRDTVPLTDNNFKIDDSVSEMTLLVFRRAGSKPTELVLPDQSRISQQNLSDNVRWHNEVAYDLITISEPESGAWVIDAELDPDNRVMIVTDLKLKTVDLPNNILIGETFDIEASLTEQGEIIIREDFLSLVDAQLKEESEIADSIVRSLNDNRREGIYRSHVGETFQTGRNDVVITMTSKTFERQRRQSINVVETPFEINVDQLMDEDTRTHRITMKPDNSLIKTEGLGITAMLTAEDGSEWSYEIMRKSDKEWQLTLADLQPWEDYTVALQIRGKTLKGRSLFIQPKVYLLHDDTPQPVEEIALPIMDDIDDEIAQIEDKEIMDEPILDEMAGGDDLLPDIDDELIALFDNEAMNVDEGGMSSSSKLLLGNGIILLLVATGVFLWRRRSATASINLGDQL